MIYKQQFLNYFCLIQMRLTIILLVISLSAKAQWRDTLSALIHAKPSIDARMESRYSFIEHTASKVSGVRLGVSFKRKLRIGAGYSWLDAEVKDKISTTDIYGNPISTYSFFKFGYVCYYVDFVFHKTKRWQLSVPIQVGTGAYWTQYNNGTSLIKSKKRLLLFYEPGITVQFKATKWCGLGLDVCARLALRNTNYVGEKLNSFIIAPKFLIWFDQIFFMTFPKSRITKKYGPASW